MKIWIGSLLFWMSQVLYLCVNYCIECINAVGSCFATVRVVIYTAPPPLGQNIKIEHKYTERAWLWHTPITYNCIILLNYIYECVLLENR